MQGVPRKARSLLLGLKANLWHFDHKEGKYVQQCLPRSRNKMGRKCSFVKPDIFFFELPDSPGSSEHKRKYGLEVTFLFATDFAIIANSC